MEVPQTELRAYSLFETHFFRKVAYLWLVNFEIKRILNIRVRISCTYAEPVFLSFSRSLILSNMCLRMFVLGYKRKASAQ